MWDERYKSAEYAYGKEPNDFLVETAGKMAGGKVLSLADGEGRNGVFLAQKGCDVTSVDSSQPGLDKAQKLATERNVKITTIHADLAEFKIEPDAWDAIVSIFCHLPTEIRKPLHRQVVNGLTAGGIYILEGYGKDQLKNKTGGPPTLDLLFDLDVIKSELDGLEFLHAVEIEREVNEGAFHAGKSSVVQIVACKPE